MKVKIMLDWDLKGQQGPMTPLLDMVTIYTPKEEFSKCISMALIKTWSQL